MKIKNKIALFLLAVLLFSVSFASYPSNVFAVAVITENETVANASGSTIPSITFSGGVTATNGTIPAITFVGGVTQVKATRTLSVGSAPSGEETITIGTCVVTFAFTEEDPDETDCSDNTAIIQTAPGLIARSTSELATALRSLSGVSDTGHGALTVSGSATNVIFTTTGTETSATAITFSDGTGGNISSSSSTTGVLGVAASVTIAITGVLAASASDASVQIDSLGAINLGSSALTAAQVAGAIRSGLTGAAGYAAKDYTVSGSDANIIFTRESTGSSGNGSLTINDDTYTSINGVAATASATVPAALPASAADQSVTIDGVAISLGSSALTATQVAAVISGTTFTSGTSYLANGAYTVSNTEAALTFTRGSTGAGGNNGLTAADTSYGGTAQTVTFTPGSLEAVSTTFSVTLNGTAYTFTSDSTSVQTIVEGLAAATAADLSVTCSENDLTLTCVSNTAGSAFTYSSSVTQNASSDSSESRIISSGSSGSKRKAILESRSSIVNNPIINAPTSSTLNSYGRFGLGSSLGSGSSFKPTLGTSSVSVIEGGLFNTDLRLGAEGSEVSRLQKWLALWPTFYPERFVTGLFGETTKTAVFRFQLTYGLVNSADDPNAGVFGPRTRELVNSFLKN